MKNRRSIIVAFLLCACLIVGVGYAAFSGNLIINGTATYTHSGADIDALINFTGFENLSHCNVAIEGGKGDTATLDVFFTKADADANHDCSATATFIISNESTATATFTKENSIVVNGTELFNVATTWIDATGAEISGNEIVAAPGTDIRIKITVTANVSAVTEDQVGTFVVQLPAVVA